MAQHPRHRGNGGGGPQDTAHRMLSKDDLHDIARLGGDILKRTIASGVEVFKEVADGLPKEATQYISQRKDEVIKGLSKDMIQGVMAMTVDKVFDVVREHRLEVRVRIRKNKPTKGRGAPDNAGTPSTPKRGKERR